MNVRTAALVAALAMLVALAQPAAAAEKKILAPFVAPALGEPAPASAVAAPALVEVREDNSSGEEDVDEASDDSAGFEDGAEESSEESGSKQQGPGYMPAPSTNSPSQQLAQQEGAGCGSSQGPCDKTPARVVSALSSDYRPFKDASKDEDAARQAALRVLAPEDREDHGDAVLQGLFKKLIETEASMKSEREWVAKVYQLIDHYREKALRVRGSVRRKGGVVYRLEQMVHARQQELAHSKLKDKLKNVNAAMTELESQTRQVDQSHKSMLATKLALRDHIRLLRHELQRMGAPNVYSS